jgi:hypothetical protein
MKSRQITVKRQTSLTKEQSIFEAIDKHHKEKEAIPTFIQGIRKCLNGWQRVLNDL